MRITQNFTILLIASCLAMPLTAFSVHESIQENNLNHKFFCNMQDVIVLLSGCQDIFLLDFVNIKFSFYGHFKKIITLGFLLFWH